MLSLDCPREYKRLVKRVYKAALGCLAKKDIYDVEVVFLGADEMRALNLRTRDIPDVTDVLSFPAYERWQTPLEKVDGRRVMLGEIAICESRMKDQAAEFGHSEKRETAFLFLHGLLHLFGFDHIEAADEKQMTDMQKRVLDKLKIVR